MGYNKLGNKYYSHQSVARKNDKREIHSHYYLTAYTTT